MTRRKEEWDIIDPNKQRAINMCKDLQHLSQHNQALALMNIRRQDPQLAAAIVKILKLTREDLHQTLNEPEAETDEPADELPQ